ncbi:MAG: Zn-ribbon domain-containing OB-fold protein [Desulfurococcaceae archaeon]|nr:Zn-ribbon domain-containing OB-fold protein [Desulfurococcaceae archaeon]
MIMSPARVWRERGSRLRLEGSRCKKCGKMFYPPKPSCPYCSSLETERIELPRKGKVISWTIEYTVPEGYRAEAPLVIALIELDNGVKVLSALTDVEPDKVYDGMEVEAVLRILWVEGAEGLIVYGIKFVPIQ